MTQTRKPLGWISGLLIVYATIASAQTAPSAPALLSPTSSASVQIPFAISWSPVSEPAGIVAYNWQVSASTSFSPVVAQNSTSGQTQATVSGLGTGTYFWRVQAVNGSFVQGAWSATRSFTVTGAGSAAPGTPMLDDPKGYSTFHPYEVMTFSWTAVPGAATYTLQVATDSRFPVATRSQFDNIPATETTYSFAIANPGHVGAPKGGRIRYVPLTRRLAAALKAARHLRGPRVLCDEEGKPLTQKMVQVMVRRVARRANAKPGLHILRHTFCSHLAMRGAPARAIQELAGHQDLGTTQRYMHLSPAALDAAIRLLDGAAEQRGGMLEASGKLR